MIHIYKLYADRQFLIMDKFIHCIINQSWFNCPLFHRSLYCFLGRYWVTNSNPVSLPGIVINSLIIHNFEFTKVVYPSNANQGSFMDWALLHEPGSCAKVFFFDWNLLKRCKNWNLKTKTMKGYYYRFFSDSHRRFLDLLKSSPRVWETQVCFESQSGDKWNGERETAECP